MDAEVLTIGDELCRGEIVDTNSSWLAGKLTELSLHVRWRTSVTDDAPDLEAAVRRAGERAHVVVASGGLGPTDDDRTVDIVARVLGVAPTQEAAHEERMRARFAERNFKLTPNNLRQVRIPTGAEPLHNRNGLAPGFHVKIGRAALFFLPGVPREMKPMFDGEVTPRIVALVGDAHKVARRTWRVAGMGESHVDHALTGLLDDLSGATLHFRIAYPECLVTVVVRRAHQPEADTVLERIDGEVRKRLGDHLYGVDDETLPHAVGHRLRERKASLAVAESCTGGLVGQLITSVAGSSEYFRGGIIAYDNNVKTQQLGVKEETLRAHGAVSDEAVSEMAEGARRVFGSTHAIAVSGIAGPGGGTVEKPVGTVHIAVAGPGGTTTRKILWPGEREQVRMIGAYGALHLLYKSLTD